MEEKNKSIEETAQQEQQKTKTEEIDMLRREELTADQQPVNEKAVHTDTKEFGMQPRTEQTGNKKRYIKWKSKKHAPREQEAPPIEAHNKKASFAKGLNFYKLFWVFLIGSFIGVVVEVLFCLLVDHYYESRQGVIYGPFNPVYGFGAVIMTMALYWLRSKRDFWVFIFGSLIGAAFEYVCSWYQETFLGTVSWDYSDMVGNIGGRTSLLYALFWGLLAIVWLKFIYPFLSKMIEKIPNRFGKALTWVLVIFMAFNCLISAAAVNRMSARHEGVEARSAFDIFLDQTYPDEFLTEIYTHMAYSDGVQTDEKPEATHSAESGEEKADTISSAKK